MNGFIICNRLSKKYGQFFSQPVFDCRASIIIIFMRPHFFVLLTYVEIILKIILKWQNSAKGHRTDLKGLFFYSNRVIAILKS